MRRACLLLLAVGGCNGQFDFDAHLPDASIVDGGAPPGADARVPLGDARVPSGDASSAGRVACGTTFCQLPQVCCLTPSSASCTANEESACAGVRLQCDSSNDCSPDLVCCATVTDTKVTWDYCEEPEFCTTRRVKLCDPSDPSECASCGPAKPPFPPGYYECH